MDKNKIFESQFLVCRCVEELLRREQESEEGEQQRQESEGQWQKKASREVEIYATVRCLLLAAENYDTDVNLSIIVIILKGDDSAVVIK